MLGAAILRLRGGHATLGVDAAAELRDDLQEYGNAGWMQLRLEQQRNEHLVAELETAARVIGELTRELERLRGGHRPRRDDEG